MKKAAFFDVDGTLTKNNIWRGIDDYFKQHNLRYGTRLAFIVYHYPLYIMLRLHLISGRALRDSWVAHLAWYVRGYSEKQAAQIWDWVVEEHVNQGWRADTRALLDEHREAGDLVLLVSACPLPLLRRIACELGVSHTIGTHLEVRNGQFTGRSLKPYCSYENKAIMTQKYLQEIGIRIDLQSSYAYADSIVDISLLEMVGDPVATYPDEDLRTVANERGWRIFPDL